MSFKAVLLAGLFVVCAFRLQQFRAPRISAFAWSAEGDWTVRVSGREWPGELEAGRVVGALIVLTLRWDGGREHLLLYRDNAGDDVRRVLRIRLRTSRVA
ncbi:hypothetical protein FHW69_003021 [Luteibacter sp. Sphag1AF]|uniref:hypothetical protein n=1 Tax=Luteibacter sp. Sphag1AF TaxID=2587031 RepID=UPI00161B4966|nr:hypothetical protein [Luteibacter sp. Sphag1AF]MBB3228386.1 hypothetical protein [Luteibacter sp. Sphag1AF]